MFKATTIIFSALFVLQGCADSSVKQEKPPSVTSNPSGADVFANSLELGTTPLRADLYEAFPAGWQNSIYQAQGVLIVKKDGCKDYTLKVNDLILRKPIHAELKCSVVSKSEKPAAIIPPPTVATHASTETRLEELEGLYKKGVVTKEEYQKTRERILNEL
jgi:hypothetical protein